MANSKPTSKKVTPRKKNWSKYEISRKFQHWAAPIVESSFGNITDQDVLDFIIDNNLADKILPRIDKGRQPINEFGPCDRFQTKDHKWESNTKEYQQLKRGIFGLPPEKLAKPEVMVERYAVGKSRGVPD